MAKVKAEALKEALKAKALKFKAEIQETIEEFKATHAELRAMSNAEIEAFVVESFNLLYDEIDDYFKFPKMVDLAAKEMLITEGVDALFDRYVEKD